MTFGVAIPTYVKHVQYLQNLLENIAKSTVKPDKISVSCSSVNVDRTVEFDVYSVPVVIQYTRAVLNPSQNRNKAAQMLTTDFISFIDGDDLAHPSRIEYIQNAFTESPSLDAIYHGYEIAERDKPFQALDVPDLIQNQTIPNPDVLGIRVGTYNIHHAHLTVRRSVFDKFKFDERPEMKYREDSAYAHGLATRGVNIGYLANPLTHYIRPG